MSPIDKLKKRFLRNASPTIHCNRCGDTDKNAFSILREKWGGLRFAIFCKSCRSKNIKDPLPPFPRASRQQSKAEKEILELVRAKFPDTQERKRGLLANKHFEFDIYVPSLKKAIEYDGTYYHNMPGAHEKDDRKNQESKEIGIELFRISESSYRNNRERTMLEIWRFLGLAE